VLSEKTQISIVALCKLWTQKFARVLPFPVVLGEDTIPQQRAEDAASRSVSEI